MKKINLLLSHKNWNSFNNYWIVNILEKYFNIIFVEENPTFSKSDTVVVFGAGGSDWIKPFQEQNYKIITEQLWNSGPVEVFPGSMLLTNKNWFWYSESLYYRSVGHDQYIPDKKYRKLALMPLWNSRLHKDMLYEQLADMLDCLLYSYVEKGIDLPNDNVYSSSRFNYFNPSWYDDTAFSIVAETRVDSEYFFISEKTFKPIAFYHPFVILGPLGILKYLRSIGFETYENLFDESYDDEPDLVLRVKKIVANVKNYKQLPYNKVVLDKLQHNHNLFFNADKVNNLLVSEVIIPINEFFETKQ